MTEGSWLGKKCDIILNLSDYPALQHVWEVWNLGWGRKVGLFHISTPKRSVELRTKKESRDLVASAGHLCLLSAALLNKLRGVYSCKMWYIRAASMLFNRSTGFKTWAMRGKAHTRLLHQNGGILRGTAQRGAPKNDIHQVLWRQRSWASVRSSFADSGLFY